MTLQVVDEYVKNTPESLKEKPYQAIVLSTKEMIDKYWAQSVPLFERCLETMHGEATVDDIYAQALQGQMFLIVIKNDETEIPDVKISIALQLVYYPRYTAMSVVAMGGRDLKKCLKDHWEDILGWARICGVTRIETSVAPAMERIMTKATGFERKYVQLEQKLSEV